MNELKSHPIFKADGLTKSYKTKLALKDLSFDLGIGDILGIIGPNGSGKTTALNIITNLIKQNEGQYNWFNGGDYQSQNIKVGVLIEGPNFFPNLTGYQNLRICAEIKGNVSGDEINRVLKKVDLSDAAHRSYKGYSLGMKQRLGIANALYGNPQVLILDEPTNGLDPAGIILVRDIIKEEAMRGTAIILCSHLLGEVAKICSKAVILKNGKTLFAGSLDDLAQSNASYIKLKSNDIEKLKTVLIMYFQGGKEINIKDGYVHIPNAQEVDPEDIAKYCYENQIILSEINKISADLEQNFLHLINQN